MKIVLSSFKYMSLLLIIGLAISCKTEKAEKQEAVTTTSEITEKKIELVRNDAEKK